MTSNSYLLVFSHEPQIVWLGFLAAGLRERRGVRTVLWVLGERDRGAGEQTGAYDEVVDLLAGFDGERARAGGSLGEDLAYLREQERALGTGFFHRFVAMDRHIERRAWPNAVNAAYAAHLLRGMHRELDRLGGKPLCALGENNVIQYRLAHLLLGPEVPYWNHSVVRHWDHRYFLDEDQGSLWPDCVRLYRRFRQQGVREPLAGLARQKLADLRGRQEQPLYTQRASRGGAGVLKKIAAGRSRVVIEDWLAEIRAGRSHDNPSVQTPWQLSPAYKTVQNFLGTVRRRFHDEHAAESLPDDAKLASYFLHVQPEHSVEGMAFEFRDQAALVENIAAHLPADLWLAVKEHKTMIGLRPVEFYQRLLRIPNLVLVSDRINPYHLIRRSEVIFTLTGTAALEAMFEAVPAVVFDDIFYDSFEGAYKVKTVAGLREAMERLGRGELRGATEDAAVATLAAEHAASHEGRLGPPYTIEEMRQPENIESLVDVIDRALRRGGTRPARVGEAASPEETP